MQAFEVVDICADLATSEASYCEFLRVPDLSVGVYNLPAGGDDPQEPHNEDEVYYVVSGQAHISVGGEDRPVKPGSVVYVPARVEHRFHSITEALHVLVFFAPAETEVNP